MGSVGLGFLVENRRDAITWAWASSSMFGSAILNGWAFGGPTAR